MFSEELRIMDRNTVRYMIDQMQKELDETKERDDLSFGVSVKHKNVLNMTDNRIKMKIAKVLHKYNL